MQTKDLGTSLGLLFSELVDGARDEGNAFVLNTGHAGLLKSLDRLSAADASRSFNEGATIAAHAQHVRYGLSLMNRWAAERWQSVRRRAMGRSLEISAVDDGPGPRYEGTRR